MNISWATHNRKVGAIIQCFSPGQTAGSALYKLLSNTDDTVPSGRLPFTWPKSLSDVCINIIIMFYHLLICIKTLQKQLKLVISSCCSS